MADFDAFGNCLMQVRHKDFSILEERFSLSESFVHSLMFELETELLSYLQRRSPWIKFERTYSEELIREELMEPLLVMSIGR